MHSMHQQLQVHDETNSHLHGLSGQATPTSASQDYHTNLANSSSVQKHEGHANMTVLAKLDAVQPPSQAPILSVLEPVQQQQQQQQSGNQSNNLIIHATPGQQEQNTNDYQHQPHLHLLGASCDQQQQQQQQQERDQLDQSDRHQADRHSSLTSHADDQSQSRHRNPQQQIESFVADGGGPIVQWLMDNYEIADGESLPRSTVYNHYIIHCRHLRIANVNAASFGKLIRSVFVGLKTRRLGTRGHSKYHYFGIRSKNPEHLEWLEETNQLNVKDRQRGSRRDPGCSSSMDPNQDNSNTDHGSESDSTGDCHSGRLSSLGGGSVSNNATSNNSKRLKRFHEGGMNESADQLDAYGQPSESHLEGELIDPNQQYVLSGSGGMGGVDYFASSNGHAVVNKQERDWSLNQYDLASLRQFLGANYESLVDQNWIQVEPGSLERQLADSCRATQNSCSGPQIEDLPSLVQTFESQYKYFYKRLVDLLVSLQIGEIEHLWSEFWHPAPHPAAHETVQQWNSSATPINGASHPTDQSLEADQHLAQQQQFYGLHNQQHHHQHQHQPMVAMPAQASLTFNQLYQLTSQPVMIDRIKQIDCKIYSALEALLMPDLLSPVPRVLIQHIRMFSRNMGTWMEAAVKDFVPTFATDKLKTIRAFEHNLRRLTSINHLASSSRAIWTRRSLLAQMSMDLNQIDLRDIEHQVSLMNQAKLDHISADNQMQQRHQQHDVLSAGGPEHQNQRQVGAVRHNGSSHQSRQDGEAGRAASATDIHGLRQSSADNIGNNYHLDSNGTSVHINQGHNHLSVDQLSFELVKPAQLIQNFLHLLDDPYPANIWPDWCRNLVDSRVSGQSIEEARNFVLKWNFYVSLILRELTLRSAPSLGSFQLIRLLFDEYMYYLVVTKLAQAQRKTPIQLLSTSIRFEEIP